MVNPLDIVSGGTAIEKQNKLARFTSIEKVVFLRREEGIPGSGEINSREGRSDTL